MRYVAMVTRPKYVLVRNEGDFDNLLFLIFDIFSNFFRWYLLQSVYISYYIKIALLCKADVLLIWKIKKHRKSHRYSYFLKSP